MSTSIDELFSWQTRVYYEDTDAGGVVYYANYLKFLERARTEWLRSHGIDQSTLIATHAVVVRQLQMDYLKPARLDDLLRINLRLIRLGPASMVLQQCVDRFDPVSVSAESTFTRLAQANVKLACVNSSNFKPSTWPVPIQEILRNR